VAAVPTVVVNVPKPIVISQPTIRVTASAAPTIAKLINSASKICYVCNKGSLLSANSAKMDNNQIMINCSSCVRSSHPNCLELNPKLVDWDCIRQYDWQCMECKRCSTCSNPHDEDKMMFCDRCDRGFHTYCVGLGQVPSGSWLCKKCTLHNEKVSKLTEKYSKTGDTLVTDYSSPSKAAAAAVVHHSPVLLPKACSMNGNDDSFSKSPTKRLSLQMKSKINSASSIRKSIVLKQTTPLTNGEKRGRGRPPGSLNKPKDPNSPKKIK
jgi:hypothetical protein